MRTFFLQLFLAFWIATVGIFLGAAILLPDGEPGSPETMRIASDASTRMLAYDVVQRYRMEGCTGIAFLSPQFKLVDENAHPLCDSSSSSDPLTIKMLATSTGTHSGRRHMGGEWIQVSAVSVESGETFFLIQRTPNVNLHTWPPFLKSAIPISILVTFLFAYFITRPIRALSLRSGNLPMAIWIFAFQSYHVDGGTSAAPM
jgi:hypothetical protein